jgi:mRNA-degrading endonuclease toxin of MazEF toxin-antitoxin module
MKANPQPGEVWFVDFGYDAKPRYCLVIASRTDARLAVSSVLQITTQHSGTPFEATLPRVPWLKEQSYVNAQSIQPVKWVEFVRRIGKFEPPVMLEINRALAAWLNLK